MRLRSALVSPGLARASSGPASACVAAWRQRASSSGKMPFSRHQAPFDASSKAAMASTAPKRAAAVQPRSRAGVASASARQRSSVAAETPSSRLTASGGSSRATARSLKACPYLPNGSLLIALGFRQPYPGDNPPDAEGSAGGTFRPQVTGYDST